MYFDTPLLRNQNISVTVKIFLHTKFTSTHLIPYKQLQKNLQSLFTPVANLSFFIHFFFRQSVTQACVSRVLNAIPQELTRKARDTSLNPLSPTWRIHWRVLHRLRILGYGYFPSLLFCTGRRNEWVLSAGFSGKQIIIGSEVLHKQHKWVWNQLVSCRSFTSRSPNCPHHPRLIWRQLARQDCEFLSRKRSLMSLGKKWLE